MLQVIAFPASDFPSPHFAWGSKRQLVVAVALIVLQTATLFALAFAVLLPFLLEGQRQFFTGSPRELLAVAIVLVYSIAFVLLTVVWFCRVPLRSLGWDTRDWKRALAWGLFGHLLTQAIFFALMPLRGESVSNYWEAMMHFTAGRRIECLLIGIQAAFVEESMYRGFLQRGFEARSPRWLAVVVTALAFAVLHLRFDPVSLFTNFSYGLVWGWLRVRTGGLVAPAFAHALNWTVNAGL